MELIALDMDELTRLLDEEATRCAEQVGNTTLVSLAVKPKVVDAPVFRFPL